MPYTLTAPVLFAGRFSRQHVLSEEGVTVGTLTYATAPDPHGISGNGGQLTPARGLHLTAWPILVEHIKGAHPRGYVPSEVEARGFDGIKALRAAIVAPITLGARF